MQEVILFGKLHDQKALRLDTRALLAAQHLHAAALLLGVKLSLDTHLAAVPGDVCSAGTSTGPFMITDTIRDNVIE